MFQPLPNEALATNQPEAYPLPYSLPTINGDSIGGILENTPTELFSNEANPSATVPEAYSTEFDDSGLRQQLLEHCTTETDFALFVFDGRSPFANAARASEARNFAEEIANDKTQPDHAELAAELFAQYGPYDENSTFLYLLDTRTGDAAGVVRITASGADGTGIKTLVDLQPYWGADPLEAVARHGIVPENTWDIASLAVEEQYRNSVAAPILYNGLHKLKDENPDITTWTTALVTDYYSKLTEFCGIPFQRILDLPDAKHMGMPTVPAYLYPAEVDEFMKQFDPFMYNLLCQGQGLEPYQNISL
jgi:hypothetical protein